MSGRMVSADKSRTLLAEATPGPWAVAHWHDRTIIPARWDQGDQMSSDPNERGDFMAATATSAEDALLIAAAPDLAHTVVVLDEAFSAASAEIERLQQEDDGKAEQIAAAIDAGHLTRQREWSLATFGPGPRLLGVLDHIRKELIEVEQDPTDVGEWVDVIILAFDGAWRAGWEPADILAAIKAKQAKNEARTWPDWRTMSEDQAIEHVEVES